MPSTAQEDIAYQPAAKAYAFSSNQTVPPTPQPTPEPQPKQEPVQEPKPKLPRKPLNWKPFLLLLGVIASLTVVFLVFLGFLNFFRVISLSTIYPNQLGWMPQVTQTTVPTYDQKAGIWTVKGTFYGYNEYVMKVKTGSQITNFQWVNNSSAALYDSEKNHYDKNYTAIPFTLYDLEKAQNLGRKVIVQYEIKNGANAINNINIFKL